MLTKRLILCVLIVLCLYPVQAFAMVHITDENGTTIHQQTVLIGRAIGPNPIRIVATSGPNIPTALRIDTLQLPSGLTIQNGVNGRGTRDIWGTAAPGTAGTYTSTFTDTGDNLQRSMVITVAKGPQTIAVGYGGSTDVTNIYVPVGATPFTLDVYSNDDNGNKINVSAVAPTLPNPQNHQPAYTFAVDSGASATVNASGQVTPGATAGSTVINIDSAATDSYEAATQKSITIHVLPLETTPAAVIDYPAENLTGLTAGEDYTVDGTPVTADGSGNIAIDESWMDGAAHDIVKKGDGATTWDSAAQSLTIPARPAAPSVTGVNETIPGANDGKITGVSTDMEWSSDSGASWTSCTWTEITNLAPGTYQVRLKAKATAFSGTAADVTIATAASIAAATVSNATVSGTAGSALGGGQTAVITLTGDAVANALTDADASGWFTALPAGITVTANAQAGSSTITLTFGGTPAAATIQPFSIITIPGNILAGGNAIPVAANPNARFNISAAPQPPSPLPKTGDGFPLGALLALLGAGLAGMAYMGTRLSKRHKQRKSA